MNDNTYDGWLGSDIFPTDETGCPNCGYWDWDAEADGMKCQICRAIEEANERGIVL